MSSSLAVADSNSLGQSVDGNAVSGGGVRRKHSSEGGGTQSQGNMQEHTEENNGEKAKDRMAFRVMEHV